MRKLIVFHIYGLGHFESLEDIEIDYLVVSYADNSVAYALSEQVNGARAHLACHYPVSRSRRSAALDMAENGCSRLNAGLGFDFLCYLSGSADALGNDNFKGLVFCNWRIRAITSRSISYSTSGTIIDVAPTAIPASSAR